MKQFTITTAVALAIVAGTTSAALAQKKWDRVDPETKDLYRISYPTDGNSIIKVEVIDNPGENASNIKEVEKVRIRAKIDKINNEKAVVTLKGDSMGPVSVNIFDSNDVLLLAELINHEKQFSVVYDLSNFKASEIKIEVSSSDRLLASKKF